MTPAHPALARRVLARLLGSTVVVFVLGASPLLAIPDPITPDHPVWHVLAGSVVVDGSVADPDWQTAVPVERTQTWRDDGTIVVRLLYSGSGLYVSAMVRDENLWSDGNGGGSGNRWELENDDSITIYIDPDGSRDEFFQATDRAFGVNLGNPGDPINGAGTVRRCKWIQGDGFGGAPDEFPCDDPSALQANRGIVWATIVDGTVNDAGDADRGWTTEIFIPWTALNRAAPSHGDTLAMNFDVIFDNDGGTRNFVNNSFGPDRFILPTFVDDHVQGAHSAYTDSQAGLRGPVAYAEVVFLDPGVIAQPQAITDLGASGASPYGARLQFTAPSATTSGSGHVAAYEIRYATSPILGEAGWLAASSFEQRYVPRLAGLAETLRIAELAPDTTYWVAVRGRDAAGHLAELSNPASFTTAASSGPDARGRVIPMPDGHGLMFEDGTPFVPIGDHMGMSWAWYRNLFPGDVWDPVNQVYQDYNANPSFEGPVGPHLDDLAASGVVVLRAFLEILNLDQTGNPETPRGRYWIEFPKRTYNPDMKQFVLNALEEAAARDIYLIFSPFDTFNWRAVFEEETPWYTGNGGPLSSIEDFYQNAGTLPMAQDRLAVVMGWVDESPFADHLLGWEPMNEWDSSWTLNAEGNAEPGRETEMRRRAVWMHDINQWVRERDPDRLVFASSASRDPRGPRARATFYDRSIDVLAPHFYTNSSEEPINNPASDRKVLPAIENALLTSYFLTHRIDTRPILNGEWGTTPAKWPGFFPQYDMNFTQAEDEAIYRTISWSAAATGQLGSGLRIAGSELQPFNQDLTPAMRDVQLTVSRFWSSSLGALDSSHFLPRSLFGRIQANSASAMLLAWGSAEDDQGVGYVLQDGNQTTGTVTDGQLVIEGLAVSTPFDATFWATQGASTSPLGPVAEVVSDGEGTLTLDLPPFDEDLAVRFAPEPAARLAAGASLLVLAALGRRRRKAR